MRETFFPAAVYSKFEWTSEIPINFTVDQFFLLCDWLLSTFSAQVWLGNQNSVVLKFSAELWLANQNSTILL